MSSKHYKGSGSSLDFGFANHLILPWVDSKLDGK